MDACTRSTLRLPFLCRPRKMALPGARISQRCSVRRVPRQLHGVKTGMMQHHAHIVSAVLAMLVIAALQACTARHVLPPPNRALDFDGMLGQAWFADRVWTFDYAARRLLLHLEAPTPMPGAHRVSLGFQTDSSGRRATSFPRISVVVGGDTLHLLFDTGATGALPPAAVAALGDTLPPVRATSFITTEVLNRWRERHPE